MKRLRKLQDEKIKYYMVGEYGTAGNRPHYHYIMFNINNKALNQIDDIWTHPLSKEPYGHIDIGSVNEASIHYVTGYLINNLPKSKIIQRPFAMMSKGLGKNYQANLKYHKENQRHYVQTKHGKQSLPKYYREKFFTDAEKRVHQKEMAEYMAVKLPAEYDRVLQLGNTPWTYTQEQITSLNKRILKNKKAKL